MTAKLDAATKDAALVAMFRHPMYLGLSFSSVEDEETDPAYQRQLVGVSEPHDDPDQADKRIVDNVVVEQRFVFIPSVVAGEIPIAVEGSARASVLRRGMVAASVDLPAIGMMRASIDNDAEVLALALGVSFEMAQELV